MNANVRRYRRCPLYLKIICGLVLGIILGLVLGKDAASLKPISDVVLGFLKLLATPLIFLAVVRSLVFTDAGARRAGRLMYLLMSNTVIAIIVGLLVANVVRPGAWVKLEVPTKSIDKKPYSLIADLLERIPKDWITPFAKNEILGVIVLSIALGIGLRVVRSAQKQAGRDDTQGLMATIETLYEVVTVVLHWVFELVPFAVLAVVANTVGTQGFAPFRSLLIFALSVILALSLMVAFYLIRLRLSSRVRPMQFLRGGVDAFSLAFSTASSAATLPVTYECATQKLHVRPENASLGVMVGGAFNHDGTALYEAMAALFVSQLIGQHLGLEQQLIVVLMSIVASVGAAGIPEAGLVTMLAVFTAVHLPTEYVAFLLPLDWLLDRCRTTVNVMGDLTSTCILDGRLPNEAAAEISHG